MRNARCSIRRMRLPQKSSSVSSRAMTMLPAVSPQSTGSADAGDRRGGVGGEERRPPAPRRSARRSRPSGYHLRSVSRTSDPATRSLPDRRAHRARAARCWRGCRSGHIPCASDLGQRRSCRPWRRCRPGRRAPRAVDRADVDDGAAALLLHLRQHGVGAVVGAVEIAVDVRRQPSGSVRARVGCVGKPGIVDEDVDRPERRRDGRTRSRTASASPISTTACGHLDAFARRVSSAKSGRPRCSGRGRRSVAPSSPK